MKANSANIQAKAKQEKTKSQKLGKEFQRSIRRDKKQY